MESTQEKVRNVEKGSSEAHFTRLSEHRRFYQGHNGDPVASRRQTKRVFGDKRETHSSVLIRKFGHEVIFIYLDSRRRALFAGRRGGERGRGLDKGGGHLRRHRSGGARAAPAVRHVAHQPHAAVHLDVDMAFGGHV